MSHYKRRRHRLNADEAGPGAGGDSKVTTTHNYRRLPPQDAAWEVDDTGVYLVLKRRWYRVRYTGILANGTKDVLIIENEGKLQLASIHHPFKGRVLHRPTHDVAVFVFTERLPEPYGTACLILEVDEDLESVIREACRRGWPMARREEYDAHLGTQYWRCK